MNLFLLLFTPVVYGFFCYICFASYTRRSDCCKSVAVAVFALFFAALVCGFHSFFVFSVDYTGIDFSVYMIRQWLLFTGVPCLIFYGIFILFSKDSWKFRLDNFLHFMLPFYTVYLPYETFSRMNEPSLFFLFVRPALCISTVLLISVALKEGIRFFNTKRSVSILIVFSALVLSIISAVFDALWYFQIPFFLWFIPSVAFAAIPVLLLLGIEAKKNS